MKMRTAARAQILLVDDEEDLTWALRYGLRDEGYDVLVAENGAKALRVARNHHPDLLILDIIMPQLDGLEVCRRVRRDPELASIPILFLSKRNDVDARVTGLDEGGDDYLTKPFDLNELRARVRALLRRTDSQMADATESEVAPTLKVRGIVLNLNARRVLARGKEIQLTPTEFEILHYLMRHPGEVFSSKQLMYQVLGYPKSPRDSSTVRWHISNLREKIEPDPQNPIHLRTVPRQGYILE